MANKSNNLDYSIQALQRGMMILDTILDARCPLSLEEIYKKTGLVKSTAFRVIINLVNSGYLTQTDQGYWLGLKILRLGVLYEEKLDIEQVALPFLQSLRDKVNETVHLAVLDNNWQVVYIEKLLPKQSIGVMMSHVGNTSPVHCTGLGKVLIAFQNEEDICSWLSRNPLKRYTNTTITNNEKLLQELKEIRQRGYAIDNAEHEVHVHCIAAPILDSRRNVIAACSVAVPDIRTHVPMIGSPLANQVMATAKSISEVLGNVNNKQTIANKLLT